MTTVSLSAQASAGGGRPTSSNDDHVVKAGETLSGIAAERGVSLDALIRANPQIINPNAIRPGQAITLPQGGGQARSYTVGAGDNLSDIGKSFGVSWQAIAQANHLANPNLIHLGQELRIPAVGGAPERAVASTPAPTASATQGQATGSVTGALPSTAGLGASQKFDLYASYVNTHGGAQAKADLAAGKQVILGLRDETAVNANGGKGAYDDRIVVLQANASGGNVREFTANTEPSSQYDGRFGEDFNGDGQRELGRMAEGTVSFQKSTSGKLGDVLRPTEAVGVQRDTNHDGRIDANDPRGAGRSTDNSFLFHAGGNGNTGSAGCQTLRPADFQNFWNGLGDQKTFNYVLVNVDRQAAPGATTAAPATGENHALGALSEQYETSGRGPGTVSSGSGDPGGVSYGSYQLAGNLGRPQQFLANEGRAWASEFGGATPGSASFTATWKAIATREPDAFKAAQHDYIERTHYNVQVQHVSTATGLDLSGRSAAVQDVAWSTSVQHGPESQVIVRAMARVDAQGVKPSEGATYDRALINAVYDERGKRNDAGGLAYFTSASADVQASVANRFAEERRDALAMLGQ